MTIKVKICGLKTTAAVDAAVAGGADYAGLVFYPPSPRNLAPERAAALAARARGRARIVALFVDPEDALLEEVISRVDPDVIQLHGREAPARLAEVRWRWGRPVMKAVHIESKADTALALRFADLADMILFDAKPPSNRPAALPGGNGLAFDWRILEDVKGKVAFMLSGGLTPDNVATAIALTGAAAVDVSSGVEVRPGEKDPALIRRFLEAAKLAGAAAPIAEDSR
jgi:phosphoribosylanthranilate isomerase